jgi:hypothetical protein
LDESQDNIETGLIESLNAIRPSVIRFAPHSEGKKESGELAVIFDVSVNRYSENILIIY